MQPASGYVKANGVSHHYLEWGREEDPPLLMLHATGLCAHPFKPLAEGLSRRFHVMAFDQRGHGDSDPSDRGYSFHLVGEDLAAIIDGLGLDRLHVVGHSSGGLATLIAASLLPGRIQQAVLVETRVGSRPASAPAQELQERAQRTLRKRPVWESREALAEAYRGRAAFKDWQGDAFLAFVEGGSRLLEDGRAALKCAPEVEAAFYQQRDDLDVSRYLRDLQGRYLLLLGSYPGGQTMEDEGVRKFLELVPGASVKPMGKGSHFLPMEHLGLVLQEAQAFFAQQD